jgi:hypothetical protein
MYPPLLNFEMGKTGAFPAVMEKEYCGSHPAKKRPSFPHSGWHSREGCKAMENTNIRHSIPHIKGLSRGYHRALWGGDCNQSEGKPWQGKA